MIFKREETRIQRIATEIPQNEATTTAKPFEYRTEMASVDYSLHQIFTATDTTYTANGMVRIAAYAACLGKDISAYKHVDADVADELKDLDWTGNSYLEPSLRILFAATLLKQYAGTAFTNHAELMRSICERLKMRAEERTLQLYEMALLRLLLPEYVIPVDTKREYRFLERNIEILNSNEKSGWRPAFRACAIARIVGIEDFPWPDDGAWRHLRKHLQLDAKDVSIDDVNIYLEDIFCARILNAEKIVVDGQGLHIFDHPLETILPKPSAARPTPKHL